MRAKFQCTEVGEIHGGAGYVTLKQTYDHTAKDINDSTNPEGSLTLDVTEKTGFFQLGHKYYMTLTDEAGSPRDNKPADKAAPKVAGPSPALKGDTAPKTAQNAPVSKGENSGFKFENGKWVKK